MRLGRSSKSSPMPLTDRQIGAANKTLLIKSLRYLDHLLRRKLLWDCHTATSVALRIGVTPRTKADRPVGEWNSFHIVMQGDRLTVIAAFGDLRQRH